MQILSIIIRCKRYKEINKEIKDKYSRIKKNLFASKSFILEVYTVNNYSLVHIEYFVDI